jgi:hypothetical protein
VTVPSAGKEELARFGSVRDCHPADGRNQREHYGAVGVIERDTDPAEVVAALEKVALILFLSFVALASGPETDAKMLGTALAAGILLDATVIRALIVPAVIALMGRWNWWLPHRPARVLRVEPSPLRPRRPREKPKRERGEPTTTCEESAMIQPACSTSS